MELISRQEGGLGVTRGAQVTGVVCASLILPWIAGILRFFVRMRIQKFVGHEDWLTVASLVVHTALCGVMLRLPAYGIGAHIENVDPRNFTVIAKLIFAGELLYVTTMAITKVAIGVYFLRLSNRRYQFWIIYGIMALSLLCNSAYLVFVLLECQPLSFFWDMFSGGTGTCLSTSVIRSVTYIQGAMSAVTDWVYGVLPITFVWKIKMNPRTKLSVILVLSLGCFASTATLVRIYYIRQLSEYTDYTWEGINLLNWSIIEPAVALTAASFSTLRPLFSYFFQKKVSRSFSDPPRPTSVASQEKFFGDEDEYSKRFAAMLGLGETYGVRTYVYADKKIVLKQDTETEQSEDTWKAGESDGSIEINELSASSQTRESRGSVGGSSHMMHSVRGINWASGYKTTVITQTSE
ncbi:hypothetical protein DSL72_000415 [Monilinia vaccinii-corymbosi]|uniref:Rhodopsin domain-containing protein n=1 Tax=Monilinia vaccinii-corymbosi TaxID=61207 RepID=A0A8A3PAB4_9HELO|nr:hypothetical protein DSL72_000415 [Monilinia vaccinii-corymbosi]